MAKNLIYKHHNIGVEIELERAASVRDKEFTYWMKKKDNSLRGEGVELIFRAPMAGALAENAIEEAYRAIESLPKKAVSVRTGIHVHIDVRDMGMKSLRCMCVLYALTEEALFDWVGNYRSLNSFCMPWYEAEGDLNKIATMLSNNKPDIAKAAARLGRYSAFNLHAIYKFGSIEARHLQTTLDKEVLYDWINILLSLKNYAAECEVTPSELISMFEELGEKRFFSLVFKDCAKLLDSSTVDLGPLVARDLLAGESEEKIGLFYAHLLKKGTPEGYSKLLTKLKGTM